jgi:hypothetical protein
MTLSPGQKVQPNLSMRISPGLRELRVDEQTDFHDGLFPPLAARSLLWV